MGFYIAGRFLPYYGLCVAFAAVSAFSLAYFLTRKRGLDSDNLMILFAYGLGGAVVGAKLLYLIVMESEINWSRLGSWSYVRSLLQTGYVFYGGLIGALLAAAAGGKIHHIPTWTYLETCVPSMPLAHGIGRIGCHLAGCCYGIPYDGAGAIVYHSPSFAPTEVSLFPVQLLETCWNLSLAIFLLIWIRKKGADYRGVCLYFLAYCPMRFILETFFRGDPERGKWLFFSPSQWISLLLACCTILFLCLRPRSKA